MIDLAKLKERMDGKQAVIVGLGKSGLPVFEACRRAGINTVLWDDNEGQRAAAKAMGGDIKNPLDGGLTNAAFVCLSPGIPLTHPAPHAVVTAAKAAGVPVIGDIEMFHRAKPDVRTIAITGTNGKSTITALCGHILQRAHALSAVGGNIGDAVLSLPDLPDDAVYVLEMSSYQIDLLDAFEPQISVLVNISPDHLDRHGGMDGYIAAKERMFRGAGTAIIGMDDKYATALFDRVKKAGARKMIPVSCLRPMPKGVYVSADGMLFDGETKIVNLNTCPALRGQHNWQNAAMAYAATRAAGVPVTDITQGLQTYPGLAHRQNILTAINGVTYINDSKATNDDAAAVALKTFTNIYWIAGGKSKGGGYKLCDTFVGNVRHAFLIGDAEEEMAEWLTRRKIPHSRCGTLAVATVAAHRMAQKEKIPKAVVLLSPACASFDQFNSFEHRGNTFAELVQKLTRKNDLRKGRTA
jgi:UDP-N-acetylmuramoylalanine--D-glutamate ligase